MAASGHLQIFLAEIQKWSRRNERGAEPGDLKLIYTDQLVRNGNENLKHMWDKLTEIFDPADARFARTLLKALSKSSEGFPRQEMENLHVREFPPGSPGAMADIDFVLRVLRHDGYLIQETTGAQATRFASDLLRDYWARQHA